MKSSIPRKLKSDIISGIARAKSNTSMALGGMSSSSTLDHESQNSDYPSFKASVASKRQPATQMGSFRSISASSVQQSKTALSAKPKCSTVTKHSVASMHSTQRTHSIPKVAQKCSESLPSKKISARSAIPCNKAASEFEAQRRSRNVRHQQKTQNTAAHSNHPRSQILESHLKSAELRHLAIDEKKRVLQKKAEVCRSLLLEHLKSQDVAENNETYLARQLTRLRAIENRYKALSSSLSEECQNLTSRRANLSQNSASLTREILQLDRLYENARHESLSTKKFLEDIYQSQKVALKILPSLRTDIYERVTAIRAKEKILDEENKALTKLQNECLYVVRDHFWACRYIKSFQCLRACISLHIPRVDDVTAVDTWTKTLSSDESKSVLLAKPNSNDFIRNQRCSILPPSPSQSNISYTPMYKSHIFHYDFTKMESEFLPDSISLPVSATPLCWLQFSTPDCSTTKDISLNKLTVPFDKIIEQDAAIRPHILIATEWLSLNPPCVETAGHSPDEPQSQMCAIDTQEQEQIIFMVEDLISKFTLSETIQAVENSIKSEPLGVIYCNIGASPLSQFSFWGSKIIRPRYVEFGSMYDPVVKHELYEVKDGILRSSVEGSEVSTEIPGILVSGISKLFKASELINESFQEGSCSNTSSIDMAIMLCTSTGRVFHNLNGIPINNLESKAETPGQRTADHFPPRLSENEGHPTLLGSTQLHQFMNMLGTLQSKGLQGVPDSSDTDFFFNSFKEESDTASFNAFESVTQSPESQNKACLVSNPESTLHPDSRVPETKKDLHVSFQPFSTAAESLETIYGIRKAAEAELTSEDLLHTGVLCRLNVACNRKSQQHGQKCEAQENLYIMFTDLQLSRKPDADIVQDPVIDDILRELQHFPTFSSDHTTYQKKQWGRHENGLMLDTNSSQDSLDDSSPDTTPKSPIGGLVKMFTDVIRMSFTRPTQLNTLRKGACSVVLAHVDDKTSMVSETQMCAMLKLVMKYRSK